jgi:dolichol kinase
MRSKLTRLFSCLAILFTISNTYGQIVPDSLAGSTIRLYDRETIYLRGGNSFIKNNLIYTGKRALAKEFLISPLGMDLYLRSRRLKGIGLAISLAASAGSIVSLLSGNRNTVRSIFWVSLGAGVVSSVMTVQGNNLRDQAVWTRNRDAMTLMQGEEQP